MALLDDLTRALRSGSPDLLADTLRTFLRRQATPLTDSRDLFVALAPVYDCATRLGLDPRQFFDAAVEGLPTEIKDAGQTFARRDDVTPKAFGFAVDTTPDGPTYRWEPN